MSTIQTVLEVIGTITCIVIALVVIFTTFFGDINIDIDRINDKQRNKRRDS